MVPEEGKDILKGNNWSQTTKLVVGLTFVAILGALVVSFQNIIPPLIITFIFSYVMHPLISYLVTKTKISWRGGVNLVFFILLVVILTSFTATSFAIVSELQDLVEVLQGFITELPELIENLSNQKYDFNTIFGPFSIDIGEIISNLNIDLLAISDQVLSAIQPLLGQAGGLIGSVATSALSGIGWGAFILVIAYFILAEGGQHPNMFKDLHLPGQMDELKRLNREMSRIWNAFLRGQVFIFLMVIISSFLLLSLLGVRNALGLALLAGLAKFVPYVGPLIAGVTTALVAFFQNGNYIGFVPLTYAIIVVVLMIILDQVFDNIVTPRIFGSTLGVHPGAVLVSALIAASMIGMIGLLLAAPALATIQLIGGYTLRKMLDLDPWPHEEKGPVDIDWPLEKQFKQLLKKIHSLRKGKKNEKSK